MAAARLTEFQPETLMEMPPGEIVRWVQARLDADELMDAWFDLEDLDA